jgi:hypothetical protein
VKKGVGPIERGCLHTVNRPGKYKGYEDGIEEDRQDDPRNPLHDRSSSASIFSASTLLIVESGASQMKKSCGLVVDRGSVLVWGDGRMCISLRRIYPELAILL